MKKLKILCLLATLWLMVGGCKDKNGCQQGPGLECATLRLAIKTTNGNPYTPCDAISSNCAVYKEDWTYANRGCGDPRDSWENNTPSSPTFSIMYIGQYEPMGVDITKIFYLKVNSDVDTLKITYRQKNLCFDLDKFEAYFNGVQVENGGNIGDSAEATKK